MWIIFAAKYSKMRIERLMMEEGLKWGFGVKYESKQVIYNMYNSNENMIPKIKGKMRLSQKSEPDFYNMVMFALNKTILFMVIRTRDAMKNAT